MNFIQMHRPLYSQTIALALILLALSGCTTPMAVNPSDATAESPLSPTENDSSPDTQSPPAGDLPAGGGDEMAERVEFEPGTTTTTINGNLSTGNDINYALAASSGQTITVEVMGDVAPVNFTVYGPAGTTWSGEAQASADNGMLTQFTAPETGDYLVTLTAPTDGTETGYEATFTVELNAVVRIAFPAGESTVERSGTLPSGTATQQYLISGNSGMTLTVDANSDAAPLSMTIESPSGNRWIPEMMPTDAGYTIGHQDVLPEPGYYIVTLAKGNEAPATAYTITFTLQ